MVGGGSIGLGVWARGGVDVGVVVVSERCLVGEVEVGGPADCRGEAEEVVVGSREVEADLEGEGDWPSGFGVELDLRKPAGEKGETTMVRPRASAMVAPARRARILSLLPMQLRLWVAGADGAKLNTAPQS